jgi:hypothetical protein
MGLGDFIQASTTMTDDQLVPRAPRRKKQPTAQKMRETIAQLTDEVMRKQAEINELKLPPRERWWHRFWSRKALALRPVALLLFCPNCLEQHIDAPDERTPDWTNPPHRSHLCHHCGHIWRPADVPTEGVAELATCGLQDGDPRPVRRPAWTLADPQETAMPGIPPADSPYAGQYDRAMVADMLRSLVAGEKKYMRSSVLEQADLLDTVEGRAAAEASQ